MRPCSARQCLAPVRTWLCLGLVGSGAFLAAFYALVGRTGLLAGPQAWLLSGSLYLAATYFVMRHYLDMRLYPRCRMLAWASILLVGGMALVATGTPASYALGAGLLALWTAAAVRPSDVRELAAAVRRRANR